MTFSNKVGVGSPSIFRWSTNARATLENWVFDPKIDLSSIIFDMWWFQLTPPLDEMLIDLGSEEVGIPSYTKNNGSMLLAFYKLRKY